MTVPKLRFKEFDGGWTKSTIQFFMDNNFILDQMDGNHGELYPKSEEFSATGVPYISATDFSFGDVNFATCKRLPIERAKLFKKGIAKNGDVLFAHNATVGPVAILKTDLDFVILSTTATYYRCEATYLNNHYLKNYFESDFFVQQYFGIMSQSTRNQVPITTQRKLNIAVPNIQEQTKIASFLSAVDEKISQLTQKHELLSQYKQGMMQKLFSQQIRFKADDGSEFGEWGNYSLKELLLKVIDNRGKTPDTNPELDIPLIEINAIGNRNVNYSKVSKFVSKDTFNSWFRAYLEDKDILFSTVGNTAICSIYSSRVQAGIAQNLVGLRARKEVVESVFLYYLLIVESNNKKFKAIEMQAVQPSIKVSQMIHINFEIPKSLTEQTKIANFLSAIDQKIEVVVQQIEQAKTWKKGLLQQMFV